MASGNGQLKMKRILFVDDDALVLETIESMFRNTRKEWDLQFAHSGSEALEIMENHPADVVVTDMRMPKMNGAVLLNEILHLYPKTVRFILSGYADMELAMHCVAGTHQFLSKPGDITSLQSTVRRAVEMDNWLNNDRVKTLVSQLNTLPSVPTLYFQILKELRSPEASVDAVGEIIAQDPAMTAKILQLVNSAFFGLALKLTEPAEAVMQMGMQTIKSLVLATHVFSELESRKDPRFSQEKLHHHSLATAVAAKRIAHLERQPKEMVDACFTAGLLHDIGRLVLAVNLPDQYAEAAALAQKQALPLVEAERAVFGVTHAETGGYLLGLWGLPGAVVEAAVFHHCPRACPSRGFAPLTAAHVASVFEQDKPAKGSRIPPQEIDPDYLAEAGVAGRLPIWSDELANGHAE
jgi:HD-like signal output (HDOD) protein/CheY-like chemotaxis protein